MSQVCHISYKILKQNICFIICHCNCQANQIYIIPRLTIHLLSLWCHAKCSNKKVCNMVGHRDCRANQINISNCQADQITSFPGWIFMCKVCHRSHKMLKHKYFQCNCQVNQIISFPGWIFTCKVCVATFPSHHSEHLIWWRRWCNAETETTIMIG